MKRFLLLLNLLFLSHSFSSLAAASDAKIYFETRIEQVRITVVSGKLLITSKVYEKRFFNEAVSPETATENVYFSGFSTLTHMSSGIGYPKGKGKYKYEPALKTTKQSQLSSSTFYSDNIKYVVEFPQVLADCYTIVSYETELTIPQFLSRFYFTDYYPALESKFSIIVDKGIDLGWELFGDQKEEIKFSKEERETETVYEWTLNDAKSIAFESGSSGFLHASTHIVPFIKTYTLNGNIKPVLRNENDLFDFYQELIKGIKEKDNEGLQKITEEIIKDAKTDVERAQLIFYWVQDNIRYVAFEEGWRGFVPYPAVEICDKRYGDCKDMTHLLVTMMRLAGLEAEHTWIGSRSLPYTYEQTPCPSVDNHLIASVLIDGNRYFLDATDAYTPFGIPTSFILSKQCLYKEKNEKAHLHYIPSYTPEFCTVVDSVFIDSKAGAAFGRGTKIVETFAYSNFYNRYAHANTERENFVREYLQLGQSNFKMNDYEVIEIEPHVKSAINFTYEIPNYLKSFGEKAYVNLNLTRPFYDQVLVKDRTRNFEIDFKQRLVSVIQFTLPTEKTEATLPQIATFDSNVGAFTASYSISGNTITYIRIIDIKLLEILPGEVPAWNQFIAELNNLYNTSIELK